MALSQDTLGMIEATAPDDGGIGDLSASPESLSSLSSLLGQGDDATSFNLADYAPAGSAGPAGPPGPAGQAGADGSPGLLRSITNTLFGPGNQAAGGGEKAPSSVTNKLLEKLKTTLDLIGIVDPTGIADLTSGGISLAQGVSALAKGEPGAAGYFTEAAISAISAIPGGDIAKVGKLPKFIKESETIQKGVKMAHGYARAHKRSNAENQMGGMGMIAGMLGGSGGGMAPAVSAGGGANFVADGEVNLKVGEAGPEFVSVQPLGQPGQSSFTPGGSGVASAAMAGGGGLLAGAAESQVIHGAYDAASSIAVDALTLDLKGLSAELIHLPGLLTDWSDALLNSRAELARVSGPQAAILAERQVRDIGRDMMTGEATAESTAALSDVMGDLRDTLQPIKNDVTNLLQNAVVPLVKALNDAVVFVKALVDSGFRPGAAAAAVALEHGREAREERDRMAFGFDAAAAFLNDFHARVEAERRRGGRVPPR